MRRTLIIAFTLLLASTTSFFIGRAGASQKANIREMMSKAEFDRAGLWKLSGSDIEALNEWLTNYRERISKEARGEVYEAEEPEELSKQTKAEICAQAALPRGWIKVGDRWNPAKCGNPTSITYNVAEIERYNDKQLGAEMDVCADTPTPDGWEESGKRWNPTTCGHPTSIVNNVKRIKRMK